MSHDRYFIDNVVTDTWYFDGSGRVIENVGGYTDLKEFLAKTEQAKTENTSKGSGESSSEKTRASQPARRERERKRRLSFKETRELESMPEEIEKTDARIQEIESIFAGSGYGSESEEFKKNIQLEYNTLTEKLEWLYQRWEELEAIANA